MQIHSLFVSDTQPELITIEYSSRFQVPGFQILGLPAPEIQEARERIASSFQAAGYEFPKKKVLVNLSPASVRKSGTGHDLAIALKILSETLDLSWPEKVLARGELGLDGSIRSVGKIAHLIELLLTRFERGSLPALILAPADHIEFLRLCQWRAEKNLPVPEPATLYRISNLSELSSVLATRPSSTNLEEALAPLALHERSAAVLLPLPRFQERIVKLGSIGRHHVLVLGPKGVGKSTSFDWFRALAPHPGPDQAWERALFLESRNERPAFDAPVRRVHAQVKPPHLLGSYGMHGFRAGELSLAHGGILFADEFMEWPRDSKECLREPLQTETLILTRVKGTLEAKCDIQLIASGNLCPCGGFPPQLKAFGYTSSLRCRCSTPEIQSYLQRLSGPILDRIDLVALFTDTPVPQEEHTRTASDLRGEIEAARTLVLGRYGCFPAKIPPQNLEKLIPRTGPTSKLLSEIGSLRSRHKTIRVALSIQALEGASELREEHVLESRSYRFLDSWI